VNLERRATKLDRVYSVIRKETHRILRLHERSERQSSKYMSSLCGHLRLTA